jgi:hypothetical protein
MTYVLIGSVSSSVDTALWPTQTEGRVTWHVKPLIEASASDMEGGLVRRDGLRCHGVSKSLTKENTKCEIVRGHLKNGAGNNQGWGCQHTP